MRCVRNISWSSRCVLCFINFFLSFFPHSFVFSCLSCYLLSYYCCRCFSSTTCSTTAALLLLLKRIASAVTEFFFVQSEVHRLLLLLSSSFSSSFFVFFFFTTSFFFVFEILFINYFAHVLFPLFAVQQAGFIPPAPGHTSEHSSITIVILPLSVVINNSFEYGQIEPVDGI